MAELRGGVAGAGVFGRYHAGKYASLPGVKLAAVYDHHPAHAEIVTRHFGGEVFDDFAAFLDAVDVVTIATPGESHAELAARALSAGKPVYVEKPLATTLADAGRLVEQAAKAGLVLASGHQERVVFEAMGLLATPEAPVLIESVRFGTPNTRSRDISCVLDLMIHDLDLALAIARAEPYAVEADGGFDTVRAEIDFESGVTAVFQASREAEARRRVMRLVYPSGEVEIDFLKPSFRNTTGFALNEDFASMLAGKDPLGTSVSRFLAAVRGEADRPAVTGEEGARALDLALAVEQAAGL